MEGGIICLELAKGGLEKSQCYVINNTIVSSLAESISP